jgi:hypothetical protein
LNFGTYIGQISAFQPIPIKLQNRIIPAKIL